ncbi:class I SAM-dependent methyltransferase [Leifsonia sp. NPDC080035]|uniref:Class I SAM-dependent methyltransferase n=1 Tax=Leifsonia sp. NPDC080035 TaxID=3143936 RepID=A0AAU7GE02_9MICO
MSFDGVAAASYDSFMGRYSTPLASLFAASARLPETGRVLDVGSGPGALTGVLAARYGVANVAAVDPADAFVAALRSRLPGVDARVASAESLPFPDDAFDAALAALVVHFMADPHRGVGELVRVTRPGGAVAACVWDFAGGRAPQSLFFGALRDVARDVDDETDRTGARGGDLPALLRAAGCVEVRETELTVEVPYPGFDDWWQPYTLGVSPAGRQLAALDPGDRDRVRSLCRDRLPSGPVVVSAKAWSASGIVPSSGRG